MYTCYIHEIIMYTQCYRVDNVCIFGITSRIHIPMSIGENIRNISLWC